MSFHSPKSSVRWAGATAPFSRCAQSHTARPRGQELHPGHALLVQCSIFHPRITHQCKLFCGFQCTTSHFSSRQDNRGSERLSVAPKATQLVGYTAKTQSWVFWLQNHVLFVQTFHSAQWVHSGCTGPPGRLMERFGATEKPKVPWAASRSRGSRLRQK